MVTKDKIIEIIKGLAHERFPDVEILRIEVVEDTDFLDEEEDVLRVKLYFTAKDGKLSASAVSGFLRHLRPKLDEVDVRSFPVMSYISGNEADAAA